MNMPDETPAVATTPPELAETEAQLAADEQEWHGMPDEDFYAELERLTGSNDVGGF